MAEVFADERWAVPTLRDEYCAVRRFRHIRRLTDPAGRMHWSEFDRGGHFPAMEAPDLLVGDLRAFFRQFR